MRHAEVEMLTSGLDLQHLTAVVAQTLVF